MESLNNNFVVTLTWQVEAELECRKQLEWGCKHVMLIENVHVDSSLKNEYDDIKKLGLEETEICLVEGLEHSIRNRVKDKENLTKREDSASKVEKDYTYKYVLALQFADRTLNRAIKDDEIAGTNLAKHILEDIGKGILELHETGRIHGDIKPPNLLRVGTAWKLADLDISCQIGEKYGKKIPSTGWCPPEVVKAIGKEQLQSLEASIAHDLWSFGTLIYYLETGTELFQVDNRDKLAETNEIIYWHKDSQQRKKLKKIKEKQEAYRLLEKLLEFDPEKRLQNFSKDGKQEAMTIVLEDGYFSQHNNLCNKMDILIDNVDEMGEQLDKISSQIIRIENLTRAQQVELKQTSKVLLHAIYEATEVQTPTTFVILDEVLPEEPEKLSALDVADGYETLADDVIVQLKKWNGQLNQAKTWIKRLSSNELMQDMNPESIAAFIKGAATELVTKKTMYFYWVDELTAQPVRAQGFPIKITKPADIVPKLLPYIQVGMCAMSIYCGSAGIAKMFGFPIPTVPKEFRIGLKESVETLKQKSSVEAFQCVHEKVEAKDGETETLRGAGLRELKAFMKEHLSHLDDDSKFAGLNRIADSDGTAIWTVKTKEEVPHALEQRTKQRKQEGALVAIDLKEDQQELKELRQRNHELEQKAQTTCCVIC
jgi:serine/threonine protein kinase